MPDLRTEIEEKITRSRDKADMDFMREYVEKMGSRKAAAAAIGMTLSGFATGLNRDNMSKTAEMAAKGVLLAMEPQPVVHSHSIPEDPTENDIRYFLHQVEKFRQNADLEWFLEDGVRLRARRITTVEY